jgi:hypothetical protein
VSLLQAQFVQADVGDHPLGIDPAPLGQLILDNPFDRLGRDPQAAGDVLGRTADQGPQHELLEAEGVGRVLALEGGDEVLTVVAASTAVEGGLVDPEAGLAPDVEVADGLGGCLVLDVGAILMAAPIAAAASGQGPADLEAVSILVAFIPGDLHTGGQVDLDHHAGHGACPIGARRLIRMPSPEIVRESNRHDNPERLSAQTTRKPSTSHFTESQESNVRPELPRVYSQA